MSARPLILLTAGGTGGHVFPAEALAEELLRRGLRLALITDKRGAAYGGTLGAIDTYRISGGGIAGRGLLRKVQSVFSLMLGYVQARRLLHSLRPAVVVGFGGYASVPAVMAASRIGIPTLVHEQNAVLGRANRLLAGRVSAIATSFAHVRKIADFWRGKVRLTGMPVRPAVLAKRGVEHGHGMITLLVIGGSQGARILSDLLPAATERLPESLRRRLSIVQQCRAEDLDRVKRHYHLQGVGADLGIFFQDIPEKLAAAHLVVARSGSSTVAELAVAGRPAILIPYPHAIDDHQRANAEAFVQAGGGWVMPQKDLTPEMLAKQLEHVLNTPDILARAARAAHDFAIPDAASRLADLTLELAALS